MKNLKSICLLWLLSLTIACEKPIEKEGYVQVEGGKIWYKMVGEGEGTPLLILHGGPGSRSCTMIPGFSLLGKDRPVIFYDQLGSGFSDRPIDTTLWRIDRFIDEIDLLREHLALEELHMLGHSCGSTFTIEYLATKKPKGVKSVVFSSPHISTPHWMADAKILVSQLPVHIRDTIAKYEALEDYEAKEYLAATDSFYARHLSRKAWPYLPNPVCDGAAEFNDQVYNHMWGPTEFTVAGSLMDFDRTPFLKEIQVPILFVTGEYDEARPETIYKFQKMANDATVEIIEGAAHMTMIDQPERVTKAIGDFLNQVDNSN
ncbi:proline iminopeptidase-family hydrolase [Reichenbachiella sp.]|uniref:proline iminopeptidase-family hydrolase n=1 Tax=Reichenbachiella sp. TaxID=2184521 RepID=UPI003B5A0AFB